MANEKRTGLASLVLETGLVKYLGLAEALAHSLRPKQLWRGSQVDQTRNHGINSAA